METLARTLLALAALLAVVGAIVLALSKLGVARLPGDITWRRGNFTVYAPIGLMILVSLVLTILLNLFFRR